MNNQYYKLLNIKIEIQRLTKLHEALCDVMPNQAIDQLLEMKYDLLWKYLMEIEDLIKRNYHENL